MPLETRTVETDAVGKTEIVPPSQVIGSLFVSEITAGVSWYLQLGNNANPAGPFSGKALSVRLGSDVPLRERNQGVYVLIKTAVTNGRIVFQVAFTGGA